jgi:hypothetical protein
MSKITFKLINIEYSFVTCGNYNFIIHNKTKYINVDAMCKSFNKKYSDCVSSKDIIKELEKFNKMPYIINKSDNHLLEGTFVHLSIATNVAKWISNELFVIINEIIIKSYYNDKFLLNKSDIKKSDVKKTDVKKTDVNKSDVNKSDLIKEIINYDNKINECSTYLDITIEKLKDFDYYKIADSIKCPKYKKINIENINKLNDTELNNILIDLKKSFNNYYYNLKSGASKVSDLQGDSKFENKYCIFSDSD